ncbi:MAG: branched-chain amino acid ABC transporter permease [Pyramidobacter sp.]|jgi:branched-chain amino acid transport system permease protein
MIDREEQRRARIISAILIVALYVAAFVAEQCLPPRSMLFTVLKKGAVYALVAVSMNLLNGFTGIFSLGQAGFMLIGAYVYCIFTIPVVSRPIVYQYFGGGIVQFTLPWFIAMFLGGIVAALFAWLIGLPVLRLKSDYLAIATLGFAEIIRAIFQWNGLGPITNGSNMLRLFTTFNDFNILAPDGTVSIYMSTTVPMVIAGLCIALMVMLINSTYGRAIRAIKDDEIAAEAMGINLASHKELAFCISSFFTGIAGAMLAMYQTSVQAKSFTSAMTYEILLVVVIGGLGSITGSCLSSFLFVACSEWWLRFLDEKHVINGFEVPLLRNGFRLVVFSIIIMIVVLFFRRGIMGTKELPDFFMGRRKKLKVQVAGASATLDAQEKRGAEKHE